MFCSLSSISPLDRLNMCHQNGQANGNAEIEHCRLNTKAPAFPKKNVLLAVLNGVALCVTRIFLFLRFCCMGAVFLMLIIIIIIVIEYQSTK